MICPSMLTHPRSESGARDVLRLGYFTHLFDGGGAAPGDLR